MFNKIIWPIVSGVISTFLANWVAGRWEGLSVRDRWLVSLAFGVGVAVAVLGLLFLRRPAAKQLQEEPQAKPEEPRGGFNDNETEGNFGAKRVALDNAKRAFSGNKTKGDFVVEDAQMRGSDE